MPPIAPDGVGDRPPTRVQVDEPGADRSDGGAGGEPLDDARGEQHGETGRGRKQDHHPGLNDERAEQHRPAADVI